MMSYDQCLVWQIVGMNFSVNHCRRGHTADVKIPDILYPRTPVDCSQDVGYGHQNMGNLVKYRTGANPSVCVSVCVYDSVPVCVCVVEYVVEWKRLCLVERRVSSAAMV